MGVFWSPKWPTVTFVSLFSSIRSDLSLRIETTSGDSHGLPSGVGVFNVVNDPSHQIDVLLFGTLANFGTGVDYKHIGGHAITILLMHTPHTSTTLDITGKLNVFSSISSNTQINFDPYLAITNHIQDDTFFKYGASVEFIRVNQHGVSMGIQHDTYNEDTIVDFTIKRVLFTTSGTSIEISIKATKTFNFVNYYLTKPPNFIFELTFLRDVK